ncbi:MAG: Fe-S cluster assembly protein SufD [Pirellulaceae bacterium]|nr:Fe-S cluster assembly protein SufD [Pirellulaceae bacterium]
MTASEPSATNAFDDVGFECFLSQRQEPDWLLAARRTAWVQFQSMAWPSRSQEQWMRSDLRSFKLQRYSLPNSEVAGSFQELNIPERLAEGVDPAGVMQTLDGATLSATLDPALAAQGVLFGDLSRAAEENSQLLQSYLGKQVDYRSDRFAALQSATWSGGQLLYVPRGICIERPFRVAAGLTSGATDTGRTLIVVDEGAEATFLYEGNSPNEQADGFHCGAVEIVVKSGGRLRYVNLQDWGRRVWHFSHQQARLSRDSSLQWTVAALGSRFSHVHQQVALAGAGAYSQVNGVLFTQDKQQLTYNTLQHHQAPSCRSDFLYKSALQDQSRTVWRGMIQVDPVAQKTDGYQRNDNLLLSNQARADSIPGLEIQADDVRCTHGSTSGKVDEELIFYAQSRGFTRKEAARMIVTGFFQQIFDRITIESVREALSQSIARQVQEYR